MRDFGPHKIRLWLALVADIAKVHWKFGSTYTPVSSLGYHEFGRAGSTASRDSSVEGCGG